MKSEILDIYNTHGKLCGKKERKSVHRDGDWHRSVICWFTYEDAIREQYLIFQKRSPEKDLYPNKIGATIGGHCPAGKEPIKTLSDELEQELRIRNISSSAIFLGIKKYCNKSLGARVDCEFQYVYLIPFDLNKVKQKCNINSSEVSELISVKLRDALRLFSNEQPKIKASTLMVAKKETLMQKQQENFVTKADFVPFSDAYYYEMLALIHRKVSNGKT